MQWKSVVYGHNQSRLVPELLFLNVNVKLLPCIDLIISTSMLWCRRKIFNTVSHLYNHSKPKQFEFKMSVSFFEVNWIKFGCDCDCVTLLAFTIPSQ